jgi:hypothetical protein
MVLTLRLLVFCFSFLAAISSLAQSNMDKGCKPPKNREWWHDRIDREQRNALRADGKADQYFQAGNNDEVNYYVTQAITRKVDQLQCKIEQDTLSKDQQKVGYLRGIENLLHNFSNLYRSRQFNAAHLPTALDAYEQAMHIDEKGEPIDQFIDQNNYDIANLLVGCNAFDRNAGINAARNCVLKKYLQLHPDRIFITLKDNPDVPGRDSLIKFAAYKYPRLLYDYAAANNRLGYAIRNIPDSFIKIVSKMATSGGSGQMYFPFLDNLIKGKMTIADINAVKDDEAKYYKLLVKTQLDYRNRYLQGDTILEMESLRKMLEKKARGYFIQTINALHESPDAVRFQILQQLNAQELYYLIVMGESDLYTSSYVHGVYPLMMQKIGNRGDSLLMSVGFDHFKKFIRMAAGYNTLSNFLASFPDKKEAQTLMTAFVNNLEKSEGLEDGVDVADSYASISETMKPVADEMLNNVKLNYDRNVGTNNKRGIVMYNLLYKLFLSATDSSIDLSKEFGIPPVYNVSYSSLVNDSTGKVVMQVFFYGDKDGLMNYSRFIPQFANGRWKKIEDNKNWITFATTKGKPFVVYANKPLDEESGELDKAQDALNNYLEEKGIQPTIIVHRGHSYWASSTIGYIKPSAKIVYLGSCGGYNLINDVLQHAPDAHIIASKQTGKIDINQPFMDLLTEKMQNGSNIDWIPFWKEFEKKSR